MAAELVSLAESWPLYQGRRISSEDIRAWLDQVDSSREKWLLFKLLQAARFISEQEIREMLRGAHGFVRQKIPALQRVPSSRSQRIFELAVVYIDGQGKSGQYYASRYAEENQVSSKCVFSSEGLERQKNEFQTKEGRKLEGIVIIDDFVETGTQLCENLEKFIRSSVWMFYLNIPVTVVAVVATKQGKEPVKEYIERNCSIGVEFRACEILAQKHQAFDRKMDCGLA